MKNQNLDTVTLRLESHRQASLKKSTLAAGRIAREMNLSVAAQGHYKKKNQLTITLISGPHVHKKSRDQYKIDRYGAFLVLCNLSGTASTSTTQPDVSATTLLHTSHSAGEPNDVHDKLAASSTALQPSTGDPKNQRDKFLEFKNKLYRLYLDEGFSMTFTYLTHEYACL
jgi:ribosomal protein S10